MAQGSAVTKGQGSNPWECPKQPDNGSGMCWGQGSASSQRSKSSFRRVHESRTWARGTNRVTLSSPSWSITVDIEVNGAVADHQPQALGWGEGCKGKGLLGDGNGAWGPGGDRSGSGSGRWGWGHTAEVHTYHVRQPIAPGPMPVLLGGPAGLGGRAQGHHGLCLQAAVWATASPPVQGDTGSTENRVHGDQPGLGSTAPPGTYSELGLQQPWEPEWRGIGVGATGQGAQGLAGSCGGHGRRKGEQGLCKGEQLLLGPPPHPRKDRERVRLEKS